MVIIEYVPYGDLLGYLRKSRGLNDTYYKDPEVKPRTNLTSQQLIKFAWQVADGMEYLSNKKVGFTFDTKFARTIIIIFYQCKFLLNELIMKRIRILRKHKKRLDICSSLLNVPFSKFAIDNSPGPGC